MRKFFKILMKVAIACISIVLASVLIVIATTGVCILLNNRDFGNKEEVLKGTTSEKALVVYQPSRLNYTREAALGIAKGLNNAGMEVTLNHPGKHLSTDVSQYSIIVFGSATYANKVSKVLVNYVKGLKNAEGKKIVIFTTGFNMDPNNQSDLKKIEDALGNQKVFEKTKFKSKGNLEKAGIKFGKKIAGE